MKRTSILSMSILLFLCLFFIGSNYQPAQTRECPTRYQALAKTKMVQGNPSRGVVLYEIKNLNTRCYKNLRIFVHVMNDYYKTKPFTRNSYLTITAYHGIGTGSWSYYTRKFPKKYTSELHAYCQIPVMGNTTRLVVFGYNLPAVKLKVDVAAYLVK